MCEFKFCQGNGTCFLNGSSPCPGRAKERRSGSVAAQAARSLGLKYDGFLDRDALIAALDLDQSSVVDMSRSEAYDRRSERVVA